MPKVSVIIPVYNVETYIDRCMKSVLEQTCEDTEILLMVGQCKDDSLNRCITWQKKDERIIIVSRKDTSLGDARNYGLKIAKGKYAIYVDADDFIRSDYIEKMIAPLEEDDTIEVTCCGFAKYSQNGIEEQILPLYEGEMIGEGFWDYTKQMGYGVVWLRAYRKDWLLANQIEMFDGCHEDDAMTIIMSVLTKRVFYIKEALYFYNTENSESLMHNAKGRCDYCKALAFAIDYLKRKNIYEPYRYEVRRYCINGIRGMRKYVGYNREFDETVIAFLTEYFPEVIGDINFRKQKKVELKGKTVLFGAGADGKRFLKANPEVPIAYIVDNNKKLRDTCICSYRIFGFDRLLEEKEKLIAEGIKVSDTLQVGIMIEIPAAAVLADQFAKEVDFFSIGTNDLIQYTFAADRMSSGVSYLYQPFNPSILRLIKFVIDSAHNEGKWVGMCGEMAGEPLAGPLLLGLGLDEFSMSATSILAQRKLIRSLSKAEMVELANKAINCSTMEEVVELVEKIAK